MMDYSSGLTLVVLAMLSLVAGMLLLMKTCKEEICCKLFYKIVAYAVIVISMLIIVFGGFKTVCKFRHHGFGPGMGMMPPMMGGKEMKPEMMMEMMKNCPMMKMMEQMQESKEAD